MLATATNSIELARVGHQCRTSVVRLHGTIIRVYICGCVGFHQFLSPFEPCGQAVNTVGHRRVIQIPGCVALAPQQVLAARWPWIVNSFASVLCVRFLGSFRSTVQCIIGILAPPGVCDLLNVTQPSHPSCSAASISELDSVRSRCSMHEYKRLVHSLYVTVHAPNNSSTLCSIDATGLLCPVSYRNEHPTLEWTMLLHCRVFSLLRVPVLSRCALGRNNRNSSALDTPPPHPPALSQH